MTDFATTFVIVLTISTLAYFVSVEYDFNKKGRK